MNPASRTPKILTKNHSPLSCWSVLMAGTALAIDQPPQEPEQQRAWLVGHLVTDMEALGTFDGNTLAKVPAIVNALTDDQVALLAQYYLPDAEQDRAGRQPLRHAAAGRHRRAGQRGEGADRRPADHDERPDRGVLRPVRPRCRSRSSTSPRSATPACRAGAAMPGATSPTGTTTTAASSVPASTPPTAGAWAVPVCNAYYDHGSHFYSRYHNVANTVYISRSINLANRHADWLRNRGDWHEHHGARPTRSSGSDRQPPRR